MIKVEHLNKYFNRRRQNEYHVINDITIDFGDKGLVTIFGESGCGKTTLLNVIGLMDKFDSGTITIGDDTFKKYQPAKFDEIRNKRIGYIFQNYNLVATKSVYDNVALPLIIVGIKDKEEIDKKVMYALKVVGLDKFKKRNVTMLSGGQQQRVAIARAIAKNPDLIIADEPTGNLDSANTFEIMNIIKEISKERLVILVSHERSIAEHYSDRVIELKDGIVVKDYNNVSSSYSFSDQRNIYLKDYELNTQVSDNSSLNIYDDKKNDTKVDLDIVIRNGEIYIKPKSGSKVHLVDELSETKFIDSSEKEFAESVKKNQNFSLDELGELSSNSKVKKTGYINFFKAIKNAFSGKNRFLKRLKFTFVAFILTTVIFTFNLASIVSKVKVDKKQFLNTSVNTVYVSLSNQESKNQEYIDELVARAKSIEGFKEIRSVETTNAYLGIRINSFYQANRPINVSGYLVDNDKYSTKIINGRDISGDNEMVISKWVAEAILKDSFAKPYGIVSFDDILGLDTAALTGEPGSAPVIIVGICDEESPVTKVSHNIYAALYDGTVTIPDYGYSRGEVTGVFIETTNKELMVQELKKNYQKVYDTVKDGKKTYFKETIEKSMRTLIALGVMTLALALYILLFSRSSMFKKIKDIGILRTVGAKRSDVINIFAGEMFSLTTVTSLIAYIASTAVILFLKFRLNLGVIGVSIFEITPLSFIIGLFLIYGLNIFAGVLPVMTLMGKTPIDIIKKYDI